MFRMTSFWPHLQHPCWFTKPTKDSSVDLIASDIPVALNLRYPFQQRKNDLGGVGVNDIDYYTICNDQIPHGSAVADSDIMIALIKSGANGRKADQNGFTPMHIMYKKGYVDVVQAMNGAGVDGVIGHHVGIGDRHHIDANPRLVCLSLRLPCWNGIPAYFSVVLRIGETKSFGSMN